MRSITGLVFVLALAIALSNEVAGSREFNILEIQASEGLPFRSVPSAILNSAQDGLPVAAKGPGLTAASGKLCQLCERYSTEALLYLKQNETQTEILSILHHECASLAPLKQQCITLVDYYVPLFFLEVSMLTPEKFCESVHLCTNGMKISLPTREGICGLCHHVLVEALVMLKDPNTQLEVIDLLLNTCSKAQNYEQCKHLVLKYIPLVLVKGQKFLETTDVCTVIHACKTGTQLSMEGMPLSATL
ncbi:proactivator polypeptide-like 1 isoform X2 [Panicum virgatum]|uniref:proactivator polypeptide-like 1 isoform X2 n=1 Tax=Panicum virgatum TaxID=38727 RepID=UPI0019D57B59|nr:proactivator polypeptide-like 1 isoform X2 [Panicum virgatum]